MTQGLVQDWSGILGIWGFWAENSFSHSFKVQSRGVSTQREHISFCQLAVVKTMTLSTFVCNLNCTYRRCRSRFQSGMVDQQLGTFG